MKQWITFYTSGSVSFVFHDTLEKLMFTCVTH